MATFSETINEIYDEMYYQVCILFCLEDYAYIEDEKYLKYFGEGKEIQKTKKHSTKYTQ